MLQNNQLQTPYREPDIGFDPRRYYEVFKKRWLFFVIPAVLVSAIGAVVVILRPATYISQGKILVESQQIPVELVRPTVTAIAAARIQVIEQRVMTRDNLLAVANKFHVFAERPSRIWGFWQSGHLSSTEILDRMRDRTKLKPVELDLPKKLQTNALAFSVSFEHEQPELAMKVANELMTTILAEDARTRTSRATETTQFLAREKKRLENELASTDAQMSEFRRKNREAVPEQVLIQLATLRSDLEQKSAIYSPSHPSLKPLQQQIAALEKITNQTADIKANFDGLQRQRASIEKNLEDVSLKLTIARRGETLERDQQAERLEVIEQAVMPTVPVKGNRLKLLVMVFGMAFAGGAGSVFAAEMLDRTVRGTSDLASMIDTHLIVGIPYISTKAELTRNRKRTIYGAQAIVVIAVAGLAAMHFLWTPLDELWDKVLLRIMG